MSENLVKLQEYITSSRSNHGFTCLYGKENVDLQKSRYLRLLRQGEKLFASSIPHIISAPGRTELGGNHTDHQNGRVLAAAVDLDCVAAVVPAPDKIVTLFSDEYQNPITLSLDSLTAKAAEKGSPEALIRGVAAARKKEGHSLCGFSGYIHATCRPGTGLSSSAAFSVLVGAVFSLFDGSEIDPLQLARHAGFAENFYFGKPCGLMDQISSAVGTTLFIDFLDPNQPVITPLRTAVFKESPYKQLIIDTGGSHRELTREYSEIPDEIQCATRILGQNRARGLTVEEVVAELPELRKRAGDRAVLRLLHVIGEDRRVISQFRALGDGRFSDFLALVAESGTSSCQMLQNCATPGQTTEQGILLALALTKQLCPDSIVRVHGGGFAGTIQAYIPTDDSSHYCTSMRRIFGKDAILPIRTGRPGVCTLTAGGWFFPPQEEKR